MCMRAMTSFINAHVHVFAPLESTQIFSLVVKQLTDFNQSVFDHVCVSKHGPGLGRILRMSA